MKLSEIKGERALEVIADLIDPVAEVVRDDGFKKTIESSDKSKVIKYLLKHHGKTVIEILAIINGEDPKTYEPSLVEIPMMLMDLFSDTQVMSLFGLQEQSMELASSGPATESIEAKKE